METIEGLIEGRQQDGLYKVRIACEPIKLELSKEHSGQKGKGIHDKRGGG